MLKDKYSLRKVKKQVGMGWCSGREVRGIEVGIIAIVLFLNIFSIVCYCKEYERAGLIGKALGDSIALVYVCVRAAS